MDKMQQPGAQVGQYRESLTSFPLTTSDIRRWAIAAYWPETPPRMYWDEEYAGQTRWGGIIAPQELNPFAWMPERPADSPSPAETRVLNGAADIEYLMPMRPGDVITSTSKVVDDYEKAGRNGKMRFTVLQEDWVNQDGQRVRTSRATFIQVPHGITGMKPPYLSHSESSEQR